MSINNLYKKSCEVITNKPFLNEIALKFSMKIATINSMVSVSHNNKIIIFSYLNSNIEDYYRNQKFKDVYDDYGELLNVHTYSRGQFIDNLNTTSTNAKNAIKIDGCYEAAIFILKNVNKCIELVNLYTRIKREDLGELYKHF